MEASENQDQRERGAAPQGADSPISHGAQAPGDDQSGVDIASISRTRRTVPDRTPLYTPEERARRDATVWTRVQGLLAPFQFLVFLVSLGLVIRYLATGEGFAAATVSIVVKTAVLFTIMITGSIWEKIVFGKWLFARTFFWEDVFSMLVLALHSAYLAAIAFGWGTHQDQMALALAAYAAYVINAIQFVWKLRLARLDGRAAAGMGPA